MEVIKVARSHICPPSSTLEALGVHYESCSASRVHTLAHIASTAGGSEGSLQQQHACAFFA